MRHNDKGAGEVVYENLRRFGAWAVASRLSLLGTKECLQQPTWISVRYGLLNLKKNKKFYFFLKKDKTLQLLIFFPTMP